MRMGTAIMVIKLDQELASVEQDPLLLLLIDLRKAYNNQKQGETTENISGVWGGTKTMGITSGI